MSRAWPAALVFTTFTFATDDYVVAGVLPEIAAALRVSEAAAGQLVTAFSLAFALAAPVASVVTATWPRRRLMFWALLVFTGGQRRGRPGDVVRRPDGAQGPGGAGGGRRRARGVRDRHLPGS
ncbi:MFS transporter [Nonomuraea dietziae]|uniref:MFS transporter n=1 Tax=Nonomuraea dietziae TaxID=65515 RepID=UPI0031D56927